jgi:Group 4 capsule polysaccharide lipoprotein gfcB, YjbF
VKYFTSSDSSSMIHRVIQLLGLVCCLSGCQGVNPTMDMMGTFLPGKDPALMVTRGFEYLLLEIDGRKTAMALGSREQVVDAGRVKVHERWYSGHREMIHMVDGRIHTALGLTVEWRGQRSAPPHWAALAGSVQPESWQRVLDLMPGYRFGQTDLIQTQASTVPRGAPSLPAGTQWFSDTVRSPQPLGGDWVYTQYFALQQGTVVYSEQCLSPEVCFKFKHLGLIP